MFKNILLATDGSKHAKKAVRVAADLAGTYKATLTIVSVAPISMSVDEIERLPQARRFPKAVKDEIKRLGAILADDASAGESLFPRVPAPHAALMALANALIDQAAAAAKRAKAGKIERAPLTGAPAEGILEQAKRSRADLIVMGTRGLSDLGGLFMGSVSHRVIHLSACPCLTVK